MMKNLFLLLGLFSLTANASVQKNLSGGLWVNNPNNNAQTLQALPIMGLHSSGNFLPMLSDSNGILETTASDSAYTPITTQTIEANSGSVYINTGDGKNIKGFPLVGVDSDGEFQPIAVDGDGKLITSGGGGGGGLVPVTDTQTGSGVILPAGNYIILTGSGLNDFSGITAQPDASEVTVLNLTGYDIIAVHAAGNGGGQDLYINQGNVTLKQYDTIKFVFNSSANFWMCLTCEYSSYAGNNKFYINNLTVNGQASVNSLAVNQYFSFNQTDNQVTGSNAVLPPVPYQTLGNASLGDVGGLTPLGTGQFSIITNKAGEEFFINHLDSAVSASARIRTIDSDTMVLNREQSAIFVYNSIESNWDMISRSVPRVFAFFYNSGVSLTDELSTITWSNTVEDNTSSMSSGVFTIPHSGDYHISFSMQLDGNYQSGDNGLAELQRNTNVFASKYFYVGSPTNSIVLSVDADYYFDRGDTFRVQVASLATSGPTITNTGRRSYLSIKLVP